LTTYEYKENLGQALKEESEALTDMWAPDLQKSTNTDPATKAEKDEEFKMLWKAKLNECMRRKCTYKNNSIKAYGLLWQHCTKGMKNKIKSRTDFQGMILQNPIELLKAIKEHSQNYQENRYSMCIILDAVMALVLCKQKENESLQDYTKQFRVARDVFESHLRGPIVLHKIVTAQERQQGQVWVIA
jgi:hypothetical protein